MSKTAIPMAMAGYLLFCNFSTVAGMTPEKKKQIRAITTDAKAMWEILPTMASDAKTTASLIKDFEEFANLPAHPANWVLEATHANCISAAAWLKTILPKQYIDGNKNSEIKDFLPPLKITYSQVIPKNIHFIWLGSHIPDKYLINIAAIATLNSDYQINIWLDDQSLVSAGSLSATQSKIRHVDQVLNHAVTSEEARNIYQLAGSKSGYSPNYAAASDILRILILLAEGGVYLDTDTCVENSEAACGFGQLKAKYGFLASTQTLSRDGQFNNSPMAAASGSPVLRDLLALAEKRYRDAAHGTQPSYGRGPGSHSWLYWVATGSRSDMRLSSTVFLSGPVLIADYLSRIGYGWLKGKHIELEEHIQPGPPAVERFTEMTDRVPYYCSSPIPPVENYFFLDNIYGDFDLTSETFGLSHKFDNSWLSPKALAAPMESKAAGVPGSASSSPRAAAPEGSPGAESETAAASGAGQPVSRPQTIAATART